MQGNSVLVTNKIKKDIEENLNEQILSIIENDNLKTAQEIIDKLDVAHIENKLFKKYTNATAFENVTTESEEAWTNLNATDFDDYDKISLNLNTRNTVGIQLRALDKLLFAYVIDTKQKSWLPLSKNLQQCLISPNDEIFRKSLQIHHKLLGTPTVCSEGFLNLIHTLILLFNNEELFRNTQEINKENKTHKRVLVIVRLLLKSQNVLFKAWLHSKPKIIEETLITFIYMLNNSTGSSQDLGLLDFLAASDLEASWFRKFCYSLQTRTILFSCLRRTPNLIKHFIGSFLDYLDGYQKNHRQFVSFMHSCNFLDEFLKHPNQNFAIFPVRIKASHEILTFESFVLVTITKINAWNESSRKKLLVELLKSMFATNPRLILNGEIQKKLFEPFTLKGRVSKKQLTGIVEKSTHVLEMMEELAIKSEVITFLSLRKPRSSKKNLSSREREHNFLQVLVNITTGCVRNYINTSETTFHVHSVIFKLFDCCRVLFASNKLTFSIVNFNRLVIALKDFYKTLSNHNTHSDRYQVKVADFLCFFIQNDYLTLNTIETESGFLNELVLRTLTNRNLVENYGQLILMISNSKEGLNAITNNNGVLVKHNLDKIWDTDGTLETEELKFLKFIYVISHSFKAAEALLELENEGTITGNDKPIVLREVIENCLDVECSCNSDTVLGLKVLKLLISNVDVLVYLQHSYKLQENLIELQVNSRLPSDSEEFPESSTAMIVDECSLLRHNILLSIKFYGTMDARFEETEIVVAPTQSSSSLKIHHRRSPNEMQKFILHSRNSLHDHNWILQARKIFKVMSKEVFKVSTVLDVLDHVPKNTVNPDFIWPPPGTVLLGLFPEEYHAAGMIIRFGVQSGLLQSSEQHEDNLLSLFRQAKTFLNFRPNEFLGADWFVGVIFLISLGNLDKSKTALLNIAGINSGPLIWPSLGNALNIKQSNGDRIFRQLEIIVEDTTRIGCALEMTGLSTRYVAKKWLDQCFFGILDIGEICNFLLLITLYPTEYILFYLAAILEHKKHDIFTAAHTRDFTILLKSNNVLDFRISNWFGFMDKLNRYYKNNLHH